MLRNLAYESGNPVYETDSSFSLIHVDPLLDYCTCDKLILRQKGPKRILTYLTNLTCALSQMHVSFLQQGLCCKVLHCNLTSVVGVGVEHKDCGTEDKCNKACRIDYKFNYIYTSCCGLDLGIECNLIFLFFQDTDLNSFGSRWCSKSLRRYHSERINQLN